MKEFIEHLAKQFEETSIEELMPQCRFRDLEEWSSITALSIIAMFKVVYEKEVTAQQIKRCNTVEDLFNILKE